MTITTTLTAIRAAQPCTDGWTKLLQHLGKTGPDDDVLDLATILDSNGLDDALWVLDNVIRDRRIARLFAADCAERVHHLFAAVYPDDDRPMAAIRVARDPEATDEQLAAARAAAGAAWAAAGAAWAAAEAARAAAGAAWAAAEAARAAAGAAWAAAGAAWAAAEAAWDAARAAAWAAEDAAGAAERTAQTARLQQYLTVGEAAAALPWPDEVAP